MSGEGRRGARGFADDLAAIRAQFERSVPSYHALIGHVLGMLGEPSSALDQALEINPNPSELREFERAVALR